LLNLIHITDCHLLNNTHDALKNTLPFSCLEQLVNRIKSNNLPADAIVVSGDISQTGNAESYQLFKQLLEQLKLPVFCVPGNHDDPIVLKSVYPNTPNELPSLHFIGDDAIILLNSKLPGQEYGEISHAAMEKLDFLLQNNNHRQIIAVVHHQAVKIHSPWMDKIGLRQADKFLQTLAQYQNVKMLLFGHVHQEISSTHEHIQLYASPATCYQFKPGTAEMILDDKNPAYRYISLSEDGKITSHVQRLD